MRFKFTVNDTQYDEYSNELRLKCQIYESPMFLQESD